MINCHVKISGVLCMLAWGIAVPSQGAMVFSDQAFGEADWEAIDLNVDVGNTFSANQQAGGGNPGAFRRMTHTIPVSGSVVIFHKYLGGTYDPSVDGAIDHLDYQEDRIQISSAAAVVGRPALIQDGVVYEGPLDIFFQGEGWHGQANPELTAEDFVEHGFLGNPEDGPHPNFSSLGEAISFGYIRGTSVQFNGLFTEHGIDNWSFTIVPVPEPGSLALLAGAGTLLLRRRARSC